MKQEESTRERQEQQLNDTIRICLPSEPDSSINPVNANLHEAFDAKLTDDEKKHKQLAQKTYDLEKLLCAFAVNHEDTFRILNDYPDITSMFLDLDLKAFFSRCQSLYKETNELMSKDFYIKAVSANMKKHGILNPVIAQYEDFYNDLCLLYKDIDSKTTDSKSKNVWLKGFIHDLILFNENSRPKNRIKVFLKDSLSGNAEIIYNNLPILATNIYYNGMFVTISNGKIYEITKDGLNAILSEHFDFISKTIIDKDGKEVLIKSNGNVPSKDLLNTVYNGLHAIANKFKYFNGFINFPVLNLETGTISLKSGYDYENKFILNDDGEWPNIPTTPDFEFLEYVFQDFPFKDKQDRTAFFAYMLSMLLLPSLNCDIPIFNFTAPRRGTGKTKAIQLAVMTVKGTKDLDIIGMADNAELEKKLTVKAINNKSYICIDNVTNTAKPLVLDCLSRYITSNQHWDSRLLGKSRDISKQWKSVISTSSNNANWGDELETRMINITLDSGLENPELRTGFAIPNIEQYCLANRKKIIVNLLSIVKSYIDAGKPIQKLQPFRCSHWNNIIIGSLQFHNYSHYKEVTEDIENESRREFVKALAICFPHERPFTVKDVRNAVSYNDSLHEAIKGLDADLDGKLVKRSIKGTDIDSCYLRSICKSLTNFVTGNFKFQKVEGKVKGIHGHGNGAVYQIKHNGSNLIEKKELNSVVEPLYSFNQLHESMRNTNINNGEQNYA